MLRTANNFGDVSSSPQHPNESSHRAEQKGAVLGADSGGFLLRQSNRFTFLNHWSFDCFFLSCLSMASNDLSVVGVGSLRWYAWGCILSLQEHLLESGSKTGGFHK